LKRIFSVLIATLLCMNMSVYAESKGVEIYVDPKSAGGDGSFEMPFKTLEEARDEVRRIKKSGYPEGGITVYLRGGNYNLNDTFELTSEDSGTENAPVIWRAYENEVPNITGGARLKVGDFQVASHDAIDETVKGRVYSCNLRQMGIDGYDKLHITGHAQHYLLLFGLLTDGDTVDFGTANPEIIFEGDVVGRLAQYPNEGYMTIDRVIDPGDRPARWGESEDSYMYVPLEERHNPPLPPIFSTADERAKRWGNAKNAWVKGYWYYDWSDQSMGVERVDAEKGIIYPKDPSGYSAKEGQRFFIFNLLEELDVPGEWYYDHDTGILYIYPVNTNPESEMLLSFASNNIIEIENAKNIILKDLNVAGTRASGIVCTNCENVDILYCTVSNISGDSGIQYAGGKNCRIIGCHVYNTGAKCIDVSAGNKQTLEPGNMLIENCWLHNFGRLLKTYAGGIKMTGVGNTARNNLIYDGVHLGVQLGGNDHIVENNDIHSVLKEADDMGAIYMGRNMVARGTVIRNNAIHDLKSDSATSVGKWAIYLDDQQCGYTVTENFIFNVSGGGVFINGGRDNTVTNNIFANMETNSVTISDQGRAFTNNKGIFDESYFGLDGIPFESEVYSKYPHVNNLREDEPLTPKYNILDKNVNYNVPIELNLSLHPTAGSTMTATEFKEKNTLNSGFMTSSDPGFLSLEKGNLELSSNSKIYKELEGFKPISMDKIGLITSRLKENLSKNAVVLKVGERRTYKNWKKELVDSSDKEIVPFIQDEVAYIPLRYVSEGLGYEISYENGTIICNKEGTEYQIITATGKVLIDTEEVEAENQIIMKNERTFISVSDFMNIFSESVLEKDGIIIIAPEENIKNIDDDMLNDLNLRM